MKPKNYIMLLNVAFLIFLGCQKEESKDAPITDPIHGTWFMVNISGGFAGLNSTFERGEVVWYFDTTNKTLNVQNNSDSNNLLYGLSPGEHSYSIVEMDGHSYLVVGKREIGGIAVLKDELTINQNNMSVGVGADRFVFKLVR